MQNVDFATNLYSISGNNKILEGAPEPASIISSSGNGVERFRELNALEMRSEQCIGRKAIHLHETFSSQLNHIMNTEDLGEL